MLASVVVHMSGAVPHTDHDGETDGGERKSSVERSQVRERRRTGDEKAEREGRRQSTQTGTERVGDLWSFAHFETVDPRDADETSEEPAAHCEGVDDQAGGQEGRPGAKNQCHTHAELQKSHDDEDARELRGLGVEADRTGVQRAGSECGETRQQMSGWLVHESETTRVVTLGSAQTAPNARRHGSASSVRHTRKSGSQRSGALYTSGEPSMRLTCSPAAAATPAGAAVSH